MTVLIDSWAWVEYFKGSTQGGKAKDYVEGTEDAVISAVNLAEVYRWFLKFYGETQAEDGRVTITMRCILIQVDEEIAVEAAKIRHSREKGLGDSIILATAKNADAKVVTGDPELKEEPEVIYIGK